MRQEVYLKATELQSKFYDAIKYALTDNDRALYNVAKHCAIICCKTAMDATHDEDDFDFYLDVLDYLKNKP